MRLFKLAMSTALMLSISAYAQNEPISVSSTETASTAVDAAVKTPTLYSPMDIQINLQLSGKDHTTLRQVSQSRTAGLVAAKVGLFALAIVGGLNGVPIPIDSGNGFSKEQLIGGVIDDTQNLENLKNPAEAVRDQLKADFKHAMIQNPTLNDKTREIPVSISAATPGWKLIYDKLAGGAEQTNQYHLMLGLSLNGTFGGQCTYNSESKSLEEWKANDYQAVADERPKIVKACVAQMQSAYAKLLGMDKVETAVALASSPVATPAAVANTKEVKDNAPTKP